MNRRQNETASPTVSRLWLRYRMSADLPTTEAPSQPAITMQDHQWSQVFSGIGARAYQLGRGSI